MEPERDLPIPVETLDTRGTLCPIPLLKTAKVMQRLQAGEVLEVVGDDPAILEDMPVYCRRAGHRLLKIEDEGGEIRCWIEKIAASDD